MICDKCKAEYKVDVFVPNEFWRVIKPRGDAGGGYLCGGCIIEAVEAAGVIAAGLGVFVTQKDLEMLKKGVA
jgi:hypothetical protein